MTESPGLVLFPLPLRGERARIRSRRLLNQPQMLVARLLQDGSPPQESGSPVSIAASVARVSQRLQIGQNTA